MSPCPGGTACLRLAVWPTVAPAPALTGTLSSAELGPHFQGPWHPREGNRASGASPTVSIRHPAPMTLVLNPDTHLGVPSIVSDILRIDNLWQFESLQKLQLDNNNIEKIEGLENLTRLVWLGEAPRSPTSLLAQCWPPPAGAPSAGSRKASVQ